MMKQKKMSITLILILLMIGLIAGIFSGMVGLGGAVIILPALIYIVGMSQYEAQGTSLAIMLPPIGALAAWNYYKAGALDLRVALIIAFAFLIGGYFGSKLALMIPQNILKKLLALLLLGIAIKLFFSKN